MTSERDERLKAIRRQVAEGRPVSLVDVLWLLDELARCEAEREHWHAHYDAAMLLEEQGAEQLRLNCGQLHTIVDALKMAGKFPLLVEQTERLLAEQEKKA